MISSPWQKPFRGMQLNRAHHLARGMVGCWVMNEATGDKVFDLSGNGNYGTITDANWVHSGLNFNSNSDMVTVIKDSTIEPQNLTIKAIVKVTESELYHVIIDKAYTSHADPYYSYHLRITNENQIYFVVIGTTTAEINQLNLDYAFTIGKTYDIAATYDGVVLKIYINGILIGSNSSAVTIAYHNTDLLIGQFRNFTTDIDIQIDTVLLYNRSLLADEIKKLYQEPYCIFQQPISPASLYYEAVAAEANPYWYYQMLRRRN